jgi:hypothetical protein
LEGRTTLTLGVLEARFEPGDGVEHAVAIETECCHLLDRQSALLL